MPESITVEYDPELIFEKITTLETTAESPDGVVRVTMTGSRVKVWLHPMRLYGVTEQALGRDIATAYQRLIREHNAEKSAILDTVPAEFRGARIKPDVRARVREEIQGIDVRVTSPARKVRARWLGDVGLQLKFADLTGCRRPDLEIEIASVLRQIGVAYHEAAEAIRIRCRNPTSYLEEE